MIFKGFKFGMLLQLAIGPVCIFIFQTALTSGVLAALLGVMGVAVVDGLFILAAILGLGTILNKNRTSRVILGYFGALVLVLFGFGTLAGAFGRSVIPSLSLGGVQSVENVFAKTLLLTLSNPMTILFWTGVFSTRVIEEKMSRRDMYGFGGGAVLSTLAFLSAVSVTGDLLGVFISGQIMRMLNMVVGCVLILFGMRSMQKATGERVG